MSVPAQSDVIVKLLLIIIALFQAASSQDMKDMSVSELIHLAEDIAQIRPNDIGSMDVTFYLVTRNSSTVKLETRDVCIDVSFNTKVLIHGWLENHKRSWYQKLTQEYLKYGDFNIIQVDWERVARSSYVSSAENTKLVGKVIGEFVIQQNLSDNIHFIGHSLGAHVAAFASKIIKANTGKKVRRITALDPAGPYFRDFFVTKDNRLNENDADIVDTIHTDGGFYGYEKPIGTLDIYVNGGKRVQPVCLKNFKIVPVGELIEESFCSHASSCQYFAEIINNKSLICTKCGSWESFLSGLCNYNEKYIFKAEELGEKMTGICYTIVEPVRISQKI